MTATLIPLLAAILASPPAHAQRASVFTVLHTNDWQSRLLGFGPNADYSPETVGDDDTIGGVARLSTLIDAERERAGGRGPVLLLDGGDVTMGTLFHTVTRETGGELRLMHQLGYDAITLGNHDFDFRPEGTARMIRAALEAGGCPPIVATNLRFDPDDPRDDDLEALAAEGVIEDYLVIERQGLRFGVFGLLGERAFEVMGQSAPLSIADPIQVARETVHTLREIERVDVVILLSHSGVERLANGAWGGPEVDYARAVPGIDLVVGGHSHTALYEPIVIGGTPIVQAGSEGRYLGRLVMEAAAHDPRMLGYDLLPVDDKLLGDASVSAVVEELREEVDRRVLAPAGLTFDEPLAETGRDLGRGLDEEALGNLVTDAYRVAAGADIAITGNGTIRADLLQGRAGVQWTSDLFRVAALGIGTHDDAPGYALTKMYFTGAELKDIFEALLILYKRKGLTYYPRVSGAQVIWNPLRVPLDRVVEIRLGDDDRGYEEVDLKADRLYSVALTSYVASFMPVIQEETHGLLRVAPKHSDGRPVDRLSDAVVDGDPSKPGLQDIKAWSAFISYVRSLPDADGDGLADLPAAGGLLDQRRLAAERSISPLRLLKNATWKMWLVSAVPIALLLMIVLAVVQRERKLKQARVDATRARAGQGRPIKLNRPPS